MPGSGSCLCGAVTYEYTGAPAMAAICHCKDCQKWAGSGNSTNVVVPKDAFKITKGEPKSYTLKGGSGQDYPHSFCGDCGSSVFGEPESMGDIVLIRAGTLDDGGSNIDVAVEFYTKDRRSFVTPVEGAKQFHTMT